MNLFNLSPLRNRLAASQKGLFNRMMASQAIARAVLSAGMFCFFMMMASVPVSGQSQETRPDISPQAARLIDYSPLVQAYPELRELMQEAARNHPELQAMQTATRAAGERAREAGVLPDPELGLMYDFNPMNADQVSQAGRFSVSLMQMMPWPGTRRSRRQAGQFSADVTQARLHDRQLEIMRDVQLAWLDLAEKQQHIRIAGQQLELVSSLEELVETRYETGRAGQADLLRIQMREERIRAFIARQRDELRPLRAQLAELLGRDEAAAPGSEAELQAVGFMQPETPEALLAQAREQHPAFNALDAETAALYMQKEVARLEGRPRFGFGLEVMGRDFGPMSMNPGGTESFIGMLSLQLPIHRSRPRAQQARIQQQLRGVEQQEVRTTNRRRSELETASEDLRSAERDLELLEDELLPRARQALELLMEAYANAETRFDEVLAMQQELLDLQNEHIQSLKRQNAATARLLRLAGAVEN